VITEDILNRVGVVLNMVGGLLLAPQLIGLDRIQSAEEAAERTIQRVHTSASLRVRDFEHKPQTLIEIFLSIFDPFTPRYWVSKAGIIMLIQGTMTLAVLTAGLSFGAHALFGWPLIVVAPVAAVTCWLLALLPVWEQWRVPKRQWAFAVAFLPLGLWNFLLGIPILFKYIAARCLVIVAGFVLGRLGGNEKLLGLLTSTGLLFFVAGSGCQFSATFV
jgi:hypothetical protein